jgi:hypothetical protein
VFTARYGLNVYVFCVDLRTAIISLYSIKSLVFITETECVYCAVRNEYLNQKDTVSSLKGSHRPYSQLIFNEFSNLLCGLNIVEKVKFLTIFRRNSN